VTNSDPPKRRELSSDEAIRVARAEADKEGWPWNEPTQAWTARRWWIGPRVWRVVSNAEMKGRNVRVEIDVLTGTVLSKSYTPR
jgi:hypothetical protein